MAQNGEGSRGFGLGILKGFALTAVHLFRRRFTILYPEKRLPVPRRIRGTELVWYVDRCTGCATCAKTCHQGVIKIVTSGPEGNRFHVDKFEVDTGYCIFCGLCVEACPFDAIFMSTEYERGKYRREDLVMSKEMLMAADKHPSAYYHPQPVPGVALPEKVPSIEETW
ncbi:MAG: NADH-quinone oxidoreductase subunit I [Dehalococcoidia bacterium]|nr:NADH-quinone oxidoreductase subunit I [Dehalococcoidia bacterium]